MLRVMLQKLWHKLWMVICLLLGSTLLIATIVSLPLYRNAAFDRLLREEFYNSLVDTGEWPGLNKMVMISKKDPNSKSILRMEGLLEGIYEQLGVTQKDTIYHYSLSKAEAKSSMEREDVANLSLRLGFLSDLSSHASMLAGEFYSEDGLSEEGEIEVVISQSCMVEANLLIGESLEFKSLKDSEGNPIKLKIMGVYEENRNNDFYWQMGPEELSSTCLMNETLFRDYFTGENSKNYTITCNYFSLFEYEDLVASKSGEFTSATYYLFKESPYRSTMSKPEYYNTLERFEGKKIRISATLFILQVPVIILLCAFLFMISGQMYDMERNEISVLKSRGGSKNQIFRLYFYQSIFLTFLGTLLGFPLGILFCKILGCAQNFLEFNLRNELPISFSKDVALYGGIGILISISIMAIPAIRHSRLTIVKLKQQRVMKKRSWWELCFMDLICLGVSLYGYYSYSKNQDKMIEDVLKAEAMDPLLYISSSLFIIGLGLLLLRLQPLIVRLIYTLGKKHWGPAAYASFMENMANGKKQQFIMLFMILTISLGMFHATVARTIVANARENEEYLSPADVIIEEVWEDNASLASSDGNVEFQFYEPDYSKYASFDNARSYTKVLYDDKAYMTDLSKARKNVTVMGIHTKEFGENTQVPDKLLEKPYYEYLNEMAVKADGILVSRNFQNILGYKIGDSITYYNADKQAATGNIVDFFDYFPGYKPVTTGLNPDGSVAYEDHYLIVAHFSSLQMSWGVRPYQVWMSLKEKENQTSLYEWIQNQNIPLKKFVDKESNLKKVAEDPLLQGTNGVLTMGFIVTILLCAVGYTIYFIMSIRAREMIFGVLRACGMHKKELLEMLLSEQLFSGVFSVVAGIFIGKITSGMFVPMLQMAYAAANQVLPMELIVNSQDMIRLYGVIAIVMMLCLGILIGIVFKLNVAKALKLGEE